MIVNISRDRDRIQNIRLPHCEEKPFFYLACKYQMCSLRTLRVIVVLIDICMFREHGLGLDREEVQIRLTRFYYPPQMFPKHIYVQMSIKTLTS